MARLALAAAALAAALVAGGCSSGSEPHCAAGQVACRSSCVDPLSDAANCGGCGFRCAVGATCAAGACACPAGEEVCGAACVDPASYASDPRNCGACGIDCGVGTCAAGACQCGGFQPCPPPAPACVDGQTDSRHCGTGPDACSRACTRANEACIAGACACPPAHPDSCPSTCTDFTSDPSNCGACGAACATGAICASRTCACPAGESVCGGACVDPRTDPSNCGGCGTACPTGASCTAGSCACPSAKPTLCGAGAAGTCCAGNGCCAGNACQTQHSNGLGQSFYDCHPLYSPPSTTTLDAARLAALAWAPGGTFETTVICDPFCVAIRPATGSGCAVWCYGASNTPGRAKATSDAICQNACPYGTSATWQ